jgi:hypothetical protein
MFFDRGFDIDRLEVTDREVVPRPAATEAFLGIQTKNLIEGFQILLAAITDELQELTK